jgi:hypothetical protein
MAAPVLRRASHGIPSPAVLRSALILIALIAASAPVGARAAGSGSLPISIGIGAFLPSSTGTSIESVPTPAGVSVMQHGDLALELAIEPNLLSGGYRIAAGVLSSRETVSTTTGQQVVGGPFGPIFTPGDESITQIPITLEQDSGLGRAIRLGGGFGYDFVNINGVNNGGTGVSRPNSGFVLDAFGQVGIGASGTLEVKYYINQHSALNGILIGLTTRL